MRGKDVENAETVTSEDETATTTTAAAASMTTTTTTTICLSEKDDTTTTTTSTTMHLDEDLYCEWLWDASAPARSSATSVVDAGREVRFHLEYSSGTAAVRGTKPLSEGHHYWEILMQSAVYGTDMMVGLGTKAVQMDKYRNQFCSFLGIDNESWGLSYTGQLHHGGKSQAYTNKFSQGTVIGIHLDMWRGTLTFYKNKQNLGVAYTGLQGKAFYPMVCSTAARSSMKILNAVYFPSSLQFMCCETIRRIVPKQLDVTEVMAMPPGLRNFLHNNLNWLLQPCEVSPLRQQEKLDKANSLIDRVRTTLDDINDRLNDKSPSDSFDECCEGVTEFSLHCDADVVDSTFFPLHLPSSSTASTSSSSSSSSSTITSSSSSSSSSSSALELNRKRGTKDETRKTKKQMTRAKEETAFTAAAAAAAAASAARVKTLEPSSSSSLSSALLTSSLSSSLASSTSLSSSSSGGGRRRLPTAPLSLAAADRGWFDDEKDQSESGIWRGGVGNETDQSESGVRRGGGARDGKDQSDRGWSLHRSLGLIDEDEEEEEEKEENISKNSDRSAESAIRLEKRRNLLDVGETSRSNADRINIPLRSNGEESMNSSGGELDSKFLTEEEVFILSDSEADDDDVQEE